MRRILVTLFGVLALVLVASACTPWQTYVAQHVNPTHVDTPYVDKDGVVHCGAYIPNGNYVEMDEACMESYPNGSHDLRFWQAHEYGHSILVPFGVQGLVIVPSLDQGKSVDDIGMVGAERAANCFAKLVTGITATLQDDLHGYWNCPQWAEDYIANVLKVHGIYWNVNDLTMPNWSR